MTSVLPPSASEDDEYASSKPSAGPVRSQHEEYVATERRVAVPVVALLVILGTVVAVMLV